MTISGTDRVLKNLNRRIGEIENRTESGVLEAALVVKRQSMILTPVKTGNLRGGCQVSSTGTRRSPRATIYYAAAYAPFVHEILRHWKTGKKIHHAPPTQWKFLETALKEKASEILNILAKHARVR